jgi:hypothetical protein
MRLVQVLRYELEGRTFNSRCGHWIFSIYLILPDRLCGLVVRVPGYRQRSPGSIPGTTRFSEQ